MQQTVQNQISKIRTDVDSPQPAGWPIVKQRGYITARRAPTCVNWLKNASGAEFPYSENPARTQCLSDQCLDGEKA